MLQVKIITWMRMPVCVCVTDREKKCSREVEYTAENEVILRRSSYVRRGYFLK